MPFAKYALFRHFIQSFVVIPYAIGRIFHDFGDEQFVSYIRHSIPKIRNKGCLAKLSNIFKVKNVEQKSYVQKLIRKLIAF